jgi:hypothetical protein
MIVVQCCLLWIDKTRVDKTYLEMLEVSPEDGTQKNLWLFIMNR